MQEKTRLSASQIGLFKRCKRAWYLRYIEKVPEPPKPWLEKGKKFHACIEDIYNKKLGKEVKEKIYTSDITEMVESGFESGVLYYPNKYLVEHEVKIDINEYAWLIGYIDFLDVSNSKIVDHKSVKSKKWMLTEKDLAENLQLNIYGYWYLNKIPNKKFVYYRHNQLNKQIPDECEFVEVKMKRDDVIDYWNTEVMPCVDEIIELKRQATKEKFLCNRGACGDYGGCDYKKNCESCGYN